MRLVGGFFLSSGVVSRPRMVMSGSVYYMVVGFGMYCTAVMWLLLARLSYLALVYALEKGLGVYQRHCLAEVAG
jgi:glucose dehydrogenase